MSMRKKRFKKTKVFLGAFLCVLFIGIAGIIAGNYFHAHFTDLNETDQSILKGLDEYHKYTEKQNIWENFNLGNKTILALNTDSGKAYLINPTANVRSIFAKEINMPSDYKIKVYRISPLSPQLFQFKFDGNFNTSEKTYKVYGNKIFYTKYSASSTTNPFSSTHYITFLSHEAFHYYMQKNWADGSTYSVDTMSDEDKELLYKEYDILTEIQKALLENTANQKVFLQYAKEYVDIINQRMEKNPTYVKEELERETTEGTATYIGIKASEIVGYDYGVMYFDNIKEVPFSDLKRTVEAGDYDKRELADRIPYESGTLLCLLMDQLEIPDWQETLNSQTRNNTITLNSIISNFVSNIE